MTANWVFWALAAGVLGFTAWSLRLLRRDPDRRRAAWLAGLRGTAAILLAWVLLQPQFRRRETVAGRPLVGVLVDASQSMNDGPAAMLRSKVAREWLDSAAFRQARETCDLRYFAFDRGLRETVLDGETGLFFAEQTAGAIADSVSRFEGAAGQITAARCRENSLKFSAERFRHEFRAWVERETTSVGAQGLEPRTSAV